jgi:hypothetical protein
MGNPLKVAEDIIELEERNEILNSLLKIVTFLSSKYAMWASIAAMTGDCQYPETSLVFDEQQDHLSSYRKEIAHMARYYRLHLGSFLAIKLVTSILMNLKDGNKKVIAVHIHGDEKIRLWKKWCQNQTWNAPPNSQHVAVLL